MVKFVINDKTKATFGIKSDDKKTMQTGSVISVNGKTGAVKISGEDFDIPTKTSDLVNDSGFLTSESDPSVPAWAKQPSKPSYTAEEVGALPNDTVVPSKTSQLTNDSGFITSETDPTVPSWAKQPTKPSYTADEVGALPSNTKIPSKTSELTNDSGYITEYTETDPTVPSWAKAATKPGYTAEEVGALANNILYAGSASQGGAAELTAGIPFGQVDSTSKATAFTATVPGITELKDGVCCMLKNGVVTSASGFTLNVNGLGAKPVYTNLAAATRDTTIFNVAYTMLFVYDEDRVAGGCWVCYRGFDANTNTIGYQLRTNSTVMNVSDTARYYKIYFTSADDTMWVPASVNSTNNATSARAVNQRPINPFGRIVYTSANTSYAAGANLAAATIWEQYTLALGYSFNRTGAALTMTVEKPVYVKCAPQADGSVIMDADTPIVQALPTVYDGKVYIYLGVAYSATNIELVPKHPVYYIDQDGRKRLWTGEAI